MIKKDDNEPDDKASRRLYEFNRQRQAVPDEKPLEDIPEDENKEDAGGDSGEDIPGKSKEKNKKTPKK